MHNSRVVVGGPTSMDDGDFGGYVALEVNLGDAIIPTLSYWNVLSAYMRARRLWA